MVAGARAGLSRPYSKDLPLIDRVLSDACLDKTDIDAVAYTSGPGLLGALIVGATVARSIAAGLGCRRWEFITWRGI